MEGAPVVDDDDLRHHHPGEDDLAGVRHRLHLRLRDLRRILAVQGVFRDDDVPGKGSLIPLRLHAHVLDGGRPRQDLRPGDVHRLVAGGLHPETVLGVGPRVPRGQAVLHGRGRQGDLLGLAGGVGGEALQGQGGVRRGIRFRKDGDAGVRDGKIVFRRNHIHLEIAGGVRGGCR